MALLAAVFVASLAGSLHCAGMCGPFVAFAVSGHPRLAPGAAAVLLPQTVYHAARLLVYVVLGAFAGLLGGVLDLGGALAGAGRAAALLAGSTLILFGLVSCLRQFAIRIPAIGYPRWLERRMAAGHRIAASHGPTPRAALIGALSALLPCGWLYGFVLAAAGTGSAVAGAALMLAFWAGTVPMLAGLGMTLHGVGRRLGPRVQLVAALAIVVLGVMTIQGRMGALDGLRGDRALPPTSSEAIAAEVARLDPSDAACCRSER